MKKMKCCEYAPWDLINNTLIFLYLANKSYKGVFVPDKYFSLM